MNRSEEKVICEKNVGSKNENENDQITLKEESIKIIMLGTKSFIRS